MNDGGWISTVVFIDSLMMILSIDDVYDDNDNDNNNSNDDDDDDKNKTYFVF